MTVTLSGLNWRAWSPSLYEINTAAGNILVAYDGKAWRLGVRNHYSEEEFPTREAAIKIVSDAFSNAMGA
jgi:hypothetical protein